jgi:DNA-nicking Smr family endonuclease
MCVACFMVLALGGFGPSLLKAFHFRARMKYTCKSVLIVHGRGDKRDNKTKILCGRAREWLKEMHGERERGGKG